MSERYECALVGSAAEARKKLAGEDFDLALCDIQMPGESGLVLAGDIAREHPGTAVVMLTGVDDPEVAEQAFAAGAHGYLVKPFWAGQLLITVANALRQHALELAELRRHEALLGSAEEKTEALRHELIDAQRRAIVDLQASRQETVERLARAIESHDLQTGQHVKRMASVAALLGSQLGLDATASDAAAHRSADARRRQDRHPRRSAAQAERADGGGAACYAGAHDGRARDPRRLRQ